ncbi:MAG: sensor histidine kinase, partial [Actinomycetota bacterium]|nr:sensor histidine kinase [Actinomycetota bacterium]
AVRGDLEAAWTRGDPALIERLVANLLDNGIRHNRPGGYLEVATRSADSHVELRVRNGGKPIAPEQAAQLVVPFHRLDRSGGGFGLGLSIVASVAAAHGGSATLTAPAEGGLQVLVCLPELGASPETAVRPRALVFGDPKASLTES